MLEGGNLQIICPGLFLSFIAELVGGRSILGNAKIGLLGIQIYLRPGCYSINGHGH